MHDAMWTTGPAVLAETVMLVSWWKPLLFVVPFAAWGFVISRVLDKHAARFFLARERWGAIYLFCGVAAILAAVAMPAIGDGGSLTFLVSLVAMTLILAAPCVAFVLAANRDERVPEHLRLKFNMAALGIEKKEKVAKTGKVEWVVKSPDKAVVAAPAAQTPEYEVRVAAEGLVTRAINNRAAQIDVAPAANNTYQARAQIDGVWGTPETMPAQAALAVIDFWKTAGKLDLADRRKKQAADVIVERGEERHKLRLHTQGGQQGVRISIVLDPEQQVRRKGEDLGLLPAQMEELKALVGEQQGVVILAGLPDGGRTTTLYSVLKMHDAYLNNVQTVETEIQDAIEGVRQNKWDPTAEGPDFSTLVRSILRRDPQVVGVAELPDAATAKEIAKADQERTRTYVVVRGSNAIDALAGWVKAVGDADAAAKCLRGVVAQKLMRKLCLNCRQPYQPTPDVLKKLGLPADKVKQLFKKGGEVLIKNKPEVCPVCQGTGYLQQDGVYEVFRIEQGERDLITQQDWSGVKGELRKRNLPSLNQAALAKAVQGTTSLEEVVRITTEGQAAAAKKPEETTKAVTNK